MAEEGFIDNIGDLTEENFDTKMEELSKKFDFDFKSGDTKVTYKGQDFEFSREFFKSKEDFINEKVKNDGVTDNELKEQATKDLKSLGITDPVDAQITSLSNSYKLEIMTKISEKPIDIEPALTETFNLETIDLISDENKSPEMREEKLNESIEKLSKKVDSLQKGIEEIKNMKSPEEVKSALEKRQEKTTNIE